MWNRAENEVGEEYIILDFGVPAPVEPSGVLCIGGLERAPARTDDKQMVILLFPRWRTG
jgi:hypothetical protein